MKKLFSIVLIASTLSFNSSAIMSIFTGGSTLALTGLGTFLGGMFVGFTELATTNRMLIGGITMMGGILILDEQNQKFEFQRISKKMALENGITEEERSIFNSELPELNLLFEEISTTIVKEEYKANAELLWEENSDMLSPEVFTTLDKFITK